MGKYSIQAAGSVNAADNHHLSFNQQGTPTTVLKLYDILIGSSDTVNDYSSRHDIIRMEGDATGGTELTPRPLDPNMGASAFTAFADATGIDRVSPLEVLMYIPLNLRATFRWVAAPGSELVVVSTAEAGIGDVCGVVNGSHSSDITFLVEE